MNEMDQPSSVGLSTEPVRWLPTDDRDEEPRGVGLALSGGGYRAMLFHLGALWRLNDLALLPTLDRVSSVSGGSITAAALGRAWNGLDFDAGGVARRFGDVADAVRGMASHTVDEAAIAVGILTADTIGERVAAAYRGRLLGNTTLQDLPDRPRFVINATNLASGALWRFSKPYMADWRVGKIPTPTLPLADAVAASSAFPPVLSPFALDLADADWQTVEGNELTSGRYRDRVLLSDGGVYDNLGLETVWKRCDTVFASDAGGRLVDDPDPPGDWARQSVRVLKVIDNQVRSLRRRQLRGSYSAKTRAGAYWSIRAGEDERAPKPALPCPPERTIALANVATRLKALDDDVQEQLINWGYAASDAALRASFRPDLPIPDGFPYPAAGVG